MSSPIILTSIALFVCVCIILWHWFQLHAIQKKLVHLQKKERQRKVHSTMQSGAMLDPQSLEDTSSPLFQAMVSLIDSGVVLVDHERLIYFLNARARELLSIEGYDYVNQGLVSLIRDYQADTLVCEVLNDFEPREMTLNMLSNDRKLHLRCAAIVPDESATGAVILIRDVTQLSMLERARRDLVANVSHELRSPLSSLQLLTETLISEPPIEITRRMLGQMAQEIESVTQLADELHELSQIESGRVTLQLAPCHIAEVITEALEHIHPQAKRKHIEVHSYIPNHPEMVLIDERRIRQVLINLLHNAVKFTADSGKITVQTCVVSVEQTQSFPKEGEHQHLSRRRYDPSKSTMGATHYHELEFAEGDEISCLDHGHDAISDEQSTKVSLPKAHSPGFWMVVSVQDSGIGIARQEQPRIFERFYKVDRSRTYSGGTGLGLAITKHLIEGHGGRLWVESKEGQGSTFYFTLPLEQSDEAA